MTRINTNAIALALLTFSACRPVDVLLLAPSVDAGTEGDASPVDASIPPIPDLLGLRITPASSAEETDPSDPAMLTFAAIGTFATGERDVTTSVTWRVIEPRFGSVERGVFTSSGIGGLVHVEASSGDAVARADLRLTLVATRWLGNGSDPQSLFDAALDGADQLAIVHPSHETALPPNVAPLPIDLESVGFDRFEISIVSGVADVRVRSRAARFELDRKLWTAILETHEGLSFTLGARALRASAPTTSARAPNVTLSVEERPIEGSIYFFSTETSGIQLTSLGSKGSTRLLPQTGCGGCHVVSRDGRRLALASGDVRPQIVSLATLEVVYPESGEAGESFAFGAFSPDGTRLLYGSGEALRLFDVDRKETIREIEFEGHLGQPDWSPDGRFVVFAYAPEERGELAPKSASGTSIARMAVLDGDRFGSIQILAAPEANETLSYPAVSPDGRFVAFVRSEGSSRDRAASRIQLVSIDGGSPIALPRLDRRGKAGVVTEPGNSQPTWAPSEQAGIDWLVFSTTRIVGSKRYELDQLFASAIQLSRVTTGEDPSAAAFWLPFQATTSGNHRAVFVGTGCARAKELCDGFDDDCDGEVDEGCCTPSEERCNGVDDDCDGVIDERCGCAPAENCTNGVDDDCNGDDDGADPACRDE